LGLELGAVLDVDPILEDDDATTILSCITVIFASVKHWNRSKISTSRETVFMPPTSCNVGIRLWIPDSILMLLSSLG
jgi:hypothetical protein